ncbi:MAG TPA: site-specific integrase, partial [Edaphobacter sp.]|uniref:tyrosine-type recombinase/integrase n=1 Tax=Edaphobacter sp. TaxID=1934404 RepID=UPI002BA571ED
FITTQIRNASKAPNTMLAALSAVRSLLGWADSYAIDLEKRFSSRHFLTESEIESLRAYFGSRDIQHELNGGKVARFPRRMESARAAPMLADDRVSSATLYNRMTYAANYLEWLAVRIVEREARHVDGETLERIKAMAYSIRRRRPNKPARSLLAARRGLSEEAQQRLLDLIRPDSPHNPFEPEVRQRNQLIVHLLYDLGVRAGELLALKVTDFNFEQNEVVVARRHGDANDPRTNQPVVKTMDRRLPLTNSLAAEVSHYVITERRRLHAARRHSFLLVTHQSGPFQGQPLSMKGLNKIFATIRESEPELLARLSPHVLRHTACDRFSALMDTNRVRVPEEEKMRSYLMGWKEGSGTAAVYTRRHTANKAREASLQLQQLRHRKKEGDNG